MHKGQVHGRCTGGGGDKCIKVKLIIGNLKFEPYFEVIYRL